MGLPGCGLVVRSATMSHRQAGTRAATFMWRPKFLCKTIVIPWLDHGTQVMKSEFKKDTITWAPWSSHGVTKEAYVFLI
jgi:hypothetical protein